MTDTEYNSIADIQPGDLIAAHRTTGWLLYVTGDMHLVYLAVNNDDEPVNLASIENDSTEHCFTLDHLESIPFKIIGNIKELIELAREQYPCLTTKYRL